MILVIDNYDSFVHNLARYVRELGLPTQVVRNDHIALDEVASLAPSAIILSPGPCTPAEAGISVPLIQRFAGIVPILGVCLGHQAIGAAYGSAIIRAPEPVHGRVSWIRHDGTPLFAGIANPFQAARYHSLIVDETTLPQELRVTARTPEGIPMALELPESRLFGVQFHPESVLTEFGHRLLINFLTLCGLAPRTDVSHDLRHLPQATSVSTAPVISPVPWPASLSEE
ncbi:MAG: aminodeoxychorismate/anthranilate synthase component II [Planctomycetales bacterium 12-60-4]|nr:MAG: aminodeoxychorismate/anthranilate synthase component II [Planctomycetales bacterium 12-60-4]